MWLLAGALLVLTAALIPIGGAALKADKAQPPSPPPANPDLQPIYLVQAGLDGEIFPAFANYAALQKPEQRRLGTVTVKIVNTTHYLLRNRVAVQVPGWSDQEIQVVEVASGETRSFLFAPTFLPRLFANREIVPATATVTATDMSTHLVFTGTAPVRLRAAEDMYWGANFKYAPFIAAWVTPHDPQIEEVLSRAKEFAPGRRLPGYENDRNTAAQVHATYVQARAIYRALQQAGISYVKSSLTFGGHGGVSERVRLPHESLRRVSANCIDGAVMYASLFENLGMDPVVVLVPGHAYVGVREAQNSQGYLYIETALTGRASFENAVVAANRGLSRYRPDQIIRIPITQSRQAGIYPMPGAPKSSVASRQSADHAAAPAAAPRASGSPSGN